MAEPNLIPTLLAFLTCDTVILDAATGKRTLVGVFHNVQAAAVPIPLNNLGLYAKLVEGSGHYEMKVKMVNLKDESPVMEIKLNVEWKQPDEPLELGLNFAGIPIPDVGTYEFQLHSDGIYLGRTVITVKKLQVPPAGAAPGQ